MADFAPNEAGFEAIARFMAKKMEDAAYGAATEWDKQLTRGPRSGNFYENYPPGVNASAYGEQPQELTGRLRDALDVQELTPTLYAVGFLKELDAENAEKVEKLEFEPPRLGGRKPVRFALRDPDIQQAAIDAIKR